MSSTTRTPVRVGQVWADNDPRIKGRTVRITDIDDTHAVVEVLTNASKVEEQLARPRSSWRPRDMRGTSTRIRLDRFVPRSTGYRLLQEASETVTDAAPATVAAARSLANDDSTTRRDLVETIETLCVELETAAERQSEAIAEQVDEHVAAALAPFLAMADSLEAAAQQLEGRRTLGAMHDADVARQRAKALRDAAAPGARR